MLRRALLNGVKNLGETHTVYIHSGQYIRTDLLISTDVYACAY